MTPEPLAGHTMGEDLKPCPFCGGECDPEGWYGADTGAGPRRGPECNECGATADSVTAWNRRASLAQQAGEDARDGWQPIETAPKDGTVVLGYGESAGEIHGPCGVMEVEPISYSGGGDYAGYDWCTTGGDVYVVWFKPTHWMPLPPPPAIDQAMKGGEG